MDVRLKPQRQPLTSSTTTTTTTVSAPAKTATKATPSPTTTPTTTSEWTPSGADIAFRRPPEEGLPIIGVAGIEAAQKTKAPPDGQKWVQARLDEIAKLTRLGVPVTVVFDLDNTVFDTRHRTLNALQEFDRANGTDHFAGATLQDMQVDGRLTATKLGLAADVVEAAGVHWDTSFWTPANLAHDAPIKDMVDLVHRARDAGATVKFLTGRTAPFHEASLQQLKKAGVDVDTTDVVCKPDLQTRTAPFKEQMMTAWSKSSELGFFVTEGVRDLEHLHGFMKDLPLLRLGCSFEEAKGDVARLPLWPAAF